MAQRARPPSPSNTNFSGISNYRSESYRPRDVPAVPQFDSKKIARIHFDELHLFLSSHLAREAPNTRASARDKLTRLTRQQFQELSTDVYDELIRRNTRSETPHLPNRDDFHPKRNQARQKLSTLQSARFKDLASDVYYELGRRYPEFKEPELLPDTPDSAYEEFPDKRALGRPSQETYRTKSPEAYTGPSARLGQGARGPDRRPTPDQQYGRRSEDNRPFGRQPSQGSRGDDAESAYSGPRRRPSNDPDSQFARKPAEQLPPGPSSATSGVVIPNKSTIAEEEIQVPYGRDSHTQGSDIRDSVISDSSGNENFKNAAAGGLSALGGSSTPAWDKSPVTPLQGGLSALAAGFDKRNESALDDDDDDDLQSGVFETSTVAGRARSGSASSGTTRKRGDTRGGLDREETEKMRQDYEYRITSLQGKVANLQDEVDKSGKMKKDDEDRIRELTSEISSLRGKQSEQSNALRDVERRLADEQSSRAELEQNLRQQHAQEVKQLRQRCEELEKEKMNMSMQSYGESEVIIADLKSGMEALVEEVKDLAYHNEELANSKESDLATIQSLEEQISDYRKKYERAKTELRGLKATSQLFLQQPRSNEQLPTSKTGAIQDSHITAFQSAADNLLSAGRSEAPSSVLIPMKAVVDAVSAIVEDARSYDIRQRSVQDPPVDYNTIENLCERAEATLSNLVAASKNHATSYGMSPVSLLDAALSHVSASVTELAKLLLIRRSPRETETGMANGSTNGQLAPTSQYGAPARTTSPPFSRFGGLSGSSSPPPSVYPTQFATRRPAQGPSTPDPTPPSAGRREWGEIKPYLDAQSEQLVSAIQGVLTAVRNPNPSVELNENVTQIITIVSSIVAVCRDSLPSSSRERGQAILKSLSDHCDKLSEVQSERTVTKESRQVMAQSSFAIAGVVKELMKL